MSDILVEMTNSITITMDNYQPEIMIRVIYHKLSIFTKPISVLSEKYRQRERPSGRAWGGAAATADQMVQKRTTIGHASGSEEQYICTAWASVNTAKTVNRNKSVSLHSEISC